MKNYSTSFAAYLQSPAAYLPCCWKITRRDGVVITLTEFDRPLVIAGHTYSAAGGIMPSDTDRRLENAADQVTLKSFFGEQVTEADVVAGRYMDAEVFVFRVNPYELPTDLNVNPLTYEPLVAGRIGTAKLTDLGYELEARGLKNRLSTQQGNVTSKTCRNQFGDSICGLDVANDWTSFHTVNIVYDRKSFGLAGASTGLFQGGEITWLTGDNAGQRSQVILQSGETFRILHPTASAIAIGDTVEITWHCDKTFRTCVTRFGNGTNFQGEPGLPGQDKLARGNG